MESTLLSFYLTSNDTDNSTVLALVDASIEYVFEQKISYWGAVSSRNCYFSKV